MSWYNNTGGFDTARQEAQKMEDRISGLGELRRVWFPNGQSKDFIFLDEQPFLVYEHQAKINGDWRNWFTCTREADCEGCAILGRKTSNFTGYFTVVSCTEYIDKKGNKHQFEIQLLPAKTQSLKMLEMRAKAKGGLTGKLWTATRTNDKSPVIGDLYDFVENKDTSKLINFANINGKKISELIEKANKDPKEKERLSRYLQLVIGSDGKIEQKLAPINYMEQLKPLDAVELKFALKGAEVKGDESSAPSGSASKSDEEVPF